MSDSPSPSDLISRRSVLISTGGILLGASVVAEPVVAAHPLGTVSVDVMQEALNREQRGIIAVNVMVPRDTISGDVSFATDTFMGVGEAFETLEEGELVSIADEYESGVANPVRVTDFGNPHDFVGSTFNGKLMHFASEDLRYPQPDNWDGTLGLGVFPDGVGDVVPDDRWDTDTVKIPLRGRDN